MNADPLEKRLTVLGIFTLHSSIVPTPGLRGTSIQILPSQTLSEQWLTGLELHDYTVQVGRAQEDADPSPIPKDRILTISN